MGRQNTLEQFFKEAEEFMENEKANETPVFGKAVDKRRVISPFKTVEVEGESVTPTPRNFESFEEIASFEDKFERLCSAKCALDEKIDSLNLQKAETSKKIYTMLVEGGYDLVNGKNRVLFCAPYKAQARYDKQAGDINPDVVRKYFPQQVEEEVFSRKVDFHALEKNLSNIPGLTLTQADAIKAAMALIEETAKKLNNKDVYVEQKVETVKDEFLIMLNEGKIDAKIAEEIQGASIQILEPKTLRIESLVSTSYGRCGCCGYEKKASEAKDPNFKCPSCGQ